MSIEQSVAKLQQLCRAGDPAALRSAIFTREAMVCGEGAPDVISGDSALLETLKTVVEMTPMLTIKVHAFRQLNDESILTWLQWTSPMPDSNEIIAFRSMTVWVREDGEWKIAGDMYGIGYFGN